MSKTKRSSRIILTPGDMVKELRLKKGWTQAQLSEITEIAVSNISNIERGNIRLGEDRAIILGAALGVSPGLILFPNGYEREDLKDKLAKIRKKLSA